MSSLPFDLLLCPDCGYDRRGTADTDRCPECGSPAPELDATVRLAYQRWAHSIVRAVDTLAVALAAAVATAAGVVLSVNGPEAFVMAAPVVLAFGLADAGALILASISFALAVPGRRAVVLMSTVVLVGVVVALTPCMLCLMSISMKTLIVVAVGRGLLPVLLGLGIARTRSLLSLPRISLGVGIGFLCSILASLGFIHAGVEIARANWSPQMSATLFGALLLDLIAHFAFFLAALPAKGRLLDPLPG